MNESALKMMGLALMALSVFMMLFGLYFPFAEPAHAGPILAWTGAVLLLAGSIVVFAIRKR